MWLLWVVLAAEHPLRNNCTVRSIYAPVLVSGCHLVGPDPPCTFVYLLLLQVTPEQLQEVRDLVRSININAELVEVQLNGANPDVPLPPWETLMNVNSFSIERALKVRHVATPSRSLSREMVGGCAAATGLSGLRECTRLAKHTAL